MENECISSNSNYTRDPGEKTNNMITLMITLLGRVGVLPDDAQIIKSLKVNVQFNLAWQST